MAPLADPLGIPFYDWADGMFRDGIVIKHLWTGIVHNVCRYPNENDYRGKIKSLEVLVGNPSFRYSISSCRGLFTLCRHAASFLTEHVDVPVIPLTHPGFPMSRTFDWDKYRQRPSVVTIGQWMRKFTSLFELDVPFPKTLIGLPDKNLYRGVEEKQGVIRQDFLEPHQYDEVLERSLVFLDFHDVTACNTIIECIIASTPVLTNRHPGNEEYLGSDYPLFFDDLEEAALKARDMELVRSAGEYLSSMNKGRFDPAYFVDSISSSDIYRDLNATRWFL